MRLRKAVPVKGRKGDEPSVGSNWEKVENFLIESARWAIDPEGWTIVEFEFNANRGTQ
jgi:hypothetical protein